MAEIIKPKNNEPFILVIERQQNEFFETGFANGYVAIPPGHPWHSECYDDIDVSIHGGLTFSQSGSVEFMDITLPEEIHNWWIIGFDTAHYGDNLSNWTKEAVEEEANRLLSQVNEAGGKNAVH